MENQQKKFSLRSIISLFLVVVVMPFLPLFISMCWDWWEAWVYAGMLIACFIISRLLVARRHPDLLAERSNFLQHKNIKSWDKYLAPLVGFGGILIPVVAGLDKLFINIFALGMPIKIVSLLMILAGYALSSYALIENRFFSGVVRIQIDRGHQVVSSGPYRWIRHPGYAGALLIYWFTPFFLDSLLTFLPVTLLTVLLIIRTHWEDQTLQDELAGYREYTMQVQYRLIPGVW